MKLITRYSNKESKTSLLLKAKRSNFSPLGSSSIIKKGISFTGSPNAKAAQKAGSAVFSRLKQWASKIHLNKVTKTSLPSGGIISDLNSKIGNEFFQKRQNEIAALIGNEALTKKMSVTSTEIVFHDKTMLGKLFDGMTYPFSWLFVDCVNSGARGLQKIPILKKSKTLQKFIDVPFLLKRANTKKANDKIAELSSILFECVEDKALKSARQKIVGHTGTVVGNYATKDERAFNRLATGFISAWFVGKDFYNLSMYQENNPDKAKESEKKRANRERGRIVISAFMTFSILGTLSKYINRNKMIAIAAITGSSLFSEIVTRLFTHTPLLPLTPEKAKKIAEKRDKNTKDASSHSNNLSIPNAPVQNISKNLPQNTISKTLLNKPAATPVKFSGLNTTVINPSELSGLNMSATNPANQKNLDPVQSSTSNSQALRSFLSKTGTTDNAEADKTNKKSEKKNKSKKKKSPVTVKRLLLAVASLFTLNVAYSLARSKIPSFNRQMTKFYDYMQKGYDSVTKTRNIVPAAELNELIRCTDLAGFSESLGKIYTSCMERKISTSASKRHTFTNYVSKFKKDVDGVKGLYYDLGLKNRKVVKPLVDILLYPITVVKKIINMPIAPLKRFAGVQKPKEVRPLLAGVYDTYAPYIKKYRDGKISAEELQSIIAKFAMKSFNENTSKLPNNVLAEISRIFVTIVSSYFFINDFRNETLIQSKGEDTETAAEVTNERVAQKVSNFFMNQMFMNFFNTTFSKAYLSSLVGATAVAGATELTNESFVRKSIGVPTKRMTREEIQKYEDDHFKREDLAGKYYRLMARITGKKTLSEKAEGEKAKKENNTKVS